MSEFAPPAVPDDATVGPQETLSPQAIENLLDDFRVWLRQHADAPAVTVPPAGEAVDVFTLVGQFVALKHEVNLQTKAVRAQQQQNAETLQQLGRAVETLEGQSAAQEQADKQGQEEQLRPILKTFVDLWDALTLAQRETQRLHDNLKTLAEPEPVADKPPTLELPPASATPARRSFWGRLFGGAAIEEGGAALAAHREALARANLHLAEQYARLVTLGERQWEARQNDERLRGMLASVLTGYTMSLQRLERGLQQHGLEPIECVGEPFDPETMEVVEVVAQPGRSGTEVIEEVRRGYWRRGRVFRFAQVRVARP